MYVYKCIQQDLFKNGVRCEETVFVIRTRPMSLADSAFMHYRVIAHWYLETMGA